MENYSAEEEGLHALSHIIGFPLGLIGGYFLLNNAISPAEYISYSIYIIALILTFTSSFAYHFVDKYSLKAKLLELDCISIYIFIAGTYTPLISLGLTSPEKWFILMGVWFFALIGVLIRYLFRHLTVVHNILYLILGLNFLFYYPIFLEIPENIIILILVGGFFYLFGFLFYGLRSLSYNHLTWHICVMFGAVSHYLAIYYV